jgi:tetratricopeptide (TPR) repeat protein
VSTSRLLGILCFSAALYAQMPQSQMPQGDFRHLQIYDEREVGPDWPEGPEREPISGVVSLRELQHPVSKKALRAAYEAQQFSRANNIPKAIAKLEKAIHVDPSYRDAHCNLGVLYARAGRITDARAEFQKALDIGPPAAPIYADLALAAAAAGEYGQAEAFARKALELDPGNTAVQRALQLFPH